MTRLLECIKGTVTLQRGRKYPVLGYQRTHGTERMEVPDFKNAEYVKVRNEYDITVTVKASRFKEDLK